MDITKIKGYLIISSIFISILGTLLHFTYEFFDKNFLIGSFSAVNESVWEHLKLLFFPMLLSTLFGYFYIGKNVSTFLCSETIGILASMLFIIVFFYTYTGIIGRSIVFLDITSFYVAVILGNYLTYKLIYNNFNCNSIIAIIILIVILMSFIIFTYFTPHIEIFRDPLTNKYGIKNC